MRRGNLAAGAVLSLIVGSFLIQGANAQLLRNVSNHPISEKDGPSFLGSIKDWFRGGSKTTTQEDKHDQQVGNSPADSEIRSLTSGGGAVPAEGMYINAGSDQDYIDSNGITWIADTDMFSYGESLTTSTQIQGTETPAIYQSQRMAGFMTYHIPVVTGETYDISLHFCQIDSTSFQVGAQVFAVFLDGTLVDDGLDVYQQAGGGYKPHVVGVNDVVAMSDVLIIQLVALHYKAMISAIEIHPAADTGDAYACDSIIVDFDTTPDGVPLEGGRYVSDEWVALGMRLYTIGGFKSNDRPRLFDASLFYYGLGNVLIVENSGESIVFDFATYASHISEIGLVNVNGEAWITIHYFDRNDVDVTDIPVMDSNSLQTIAIEKSNVKELEIEFTRSGAVTFISFCSTESPPATTEGTIPSSTRPNEPTSPDTTLSQSVEPDNAPEPTTKECQVAEIDFNELPDGTRLAGGEYLGNQYKQFYGIEFSAFGGLGNIPRLFDTANVGTFERGDPDLGSPNRQCPGGGPGIGRGGVPGPYGDNPYQNCDFLGNVLIIQEDNGFEEQPDDNWDGGVITMDFSPVAEIVHEIAFLDVDYPISITVVYIDAEGTTQEKPPLDVPLRGNNSYQKLALNEENVAQIRINMQHSGAVASLKFCNTVQDKDTDPTTRAIATTSTTSTVVATTSTTELPTSQFSTTASTTMAPETAATTSTTKDASPATDDPSACPGYFSAMEPNQCCSLDEVTVDEQCGLDYPTIDESRKCVHSGSQAEIPYRGNSNCEKLGFDFGLKLPERCSSQDSIEFDFINDSAGGNIVRTGVAECPCESPVFPSGSFSISCVLDDNVNRRATVTSNVDVWLNVKAEPMGGTLYKLPAGNERLVAPVNTDACLSAADDGSCKAIKFIEFCFMCPTSTAPTTIADPTTTIEERTTEAPLPDTTTASTTAAPTDPIATTTETTKNDPTVLPPTPLPTPSPTPEPTPFPTPLPTPLPTLAPTPSPTTEPTPLPTPFPTRAPTEARSPTATAQGKYGLQTSCLTLDESKYNICLDLTSTTPNRGFQPWMQTVIDAAARWERVVVGDLTPRSTASLPNPPTPPSLSRGCTAMPDVIDDFYICVQDDQLSNSIGYGGYYLTREIDKINPRTGRNYRLPYGGYVGISDSILGDDDKDDLLNLAIHEIGHGMGFPFFLEPNFSNIITSNLYATGTNADNAWKALGCSGRIPLQSTRGHWNEGCLSDEVMTPTLFTGRPNPLSSITVAAMADMGYDVDYSEADSFTIQDLGNSCGASCPQAGNQRNLGVGSHTQGYRHQLSDERKMAVFQEMKDKILYFHEQLESSGFVQGRGGIYAIEQVDVLLFDDVGELQTLTVSYDDVKDL